MPKPITLFLSPLWTATSIVQAQKVKYKDIFPLLEVKDYETAIPKLETFLADPKTESHANANFQMSIYFENQVSNYHLINDSTDILKAAEQGLVYLKKAKNLITEKELKKNSEYYKAYERRDLRTGDFGIKISDVQLDVDKKIESITGIVENGSEIYSKLSATHDANTFCLDTYKSFVDKYGSINKLYLSATTDELTLLQKMMEAKADMEDDFKKVRNAVSKIESKGYSPELEFKVIKDFGVDGVAEVSFFVNDIEAWDYGTWAQETYTKIDREIRKLHQELIKIDKKLKQDLQSVKSSDAVPYSEITHVVNTKALSQIKQYDEDPVILKFLSSLIKTNEYEFIVNPIQNPRIEDLEDVNYQLLITDSLVSILEEIESDIEVLIEPAATETKNKYAPLIKDEYGTDFRLTKYRKKMETFLDNSMDTWRKRKEKITLRSIWALNEAKGDSIYLLSESDELYEVPMYDKYYTVVTAKGDSSIIYALGFEFMSSTPKGYFAAISNKRKVLWETNFDLKGFTYGDNKSLLTVGQFVTSQKGTVSAYIYSTGASAAKNLVVLSADLEAQELKWLNALKVSNQPVDVKFNLLVKETVFYLKTEEELENYAGDDSGYFVIDRSGKIR